MDIKITKETIGQSTIFGHKLPHIRIKQKEKETKYLLLRYVLNTFYPNAPKSTMASRMEKLNIRKINLSSEQGERLKNFLSNDSPVNPAYIYLVSELDVLRLCNKFPVETKRETTNSCKRRLENPDEIEKVKKAKHDHDTQSKEDEKVPQGQLIEHTPFCKEKSCKQKHHKLLIAILNSDEKFPLFEETVKKYLQKGWKESDPIPDDEDEFCYPVIHWAAVLCKVKALDWLISHGFHVNCQSSIRGETALHRVTGFLPGTMQEYKLVKILELFAHIVDKLRGSLSMQDDNLDTPLIVATKWIVEHQCNLEYFHNVVKILIRKIVDHHDKSILDFKNIEGNTALHILSQDHDSAPLVKLLLENGASLNLCNEDNDLPIDIASKFNNQAVKRVIKRHMELQKESDEKEIRQAVQDIPITDEREMSVELSDAMEKLDNVLEPVDTERKVDPKPTGSSKEVLVGSETKTNRNSQNSSSSGGSQSSAKEVKTETVAVKGKGSDRRSVNQSGVKDHARSTKIAEDEPQSNVKQGQKDTEKHDTGTQKRDAKNCANESKIFESVSKSNVSSAKMNVKVDARIGGENKSSSVGLKNDGAKKIKSETSENMSDTGKGVRHESKDGDGSIKNEMCKDKKGDLESQPDVHKSESGGTEVSQRCNTKISANVKGQGNPSRTSCEEHKHINNVCEPDKNASKSDSGTDYQTESSTVERNMWGKFSQIIGQQEKKSEQNTDDTSNVDSDEGIGEAMQEEQASGNNDSALAVFSILQDAGCLADTMSIIIEKKKSHEKELVEEKKKVADIEQQVQMKQDEINKKKQYILSITEEVRKLFSKINVHNKQIEILEKQKREVEKSKEEHVQNCIGLTRKLECTQAILDASKS